MTATSHGPRVSLPPAVLDPWAAEWPGGVQFLQLRPTRGTPDLRHQPAGTVPQHDADGDGARLVEAVASRIWASWLGDAKTTAADRDVAGRLAEVAPALPGMVRAARRFRDTAFRDALREPGFRQLLDLAAGVPLRPSHLEALTALPMLPGPVVRVEHDPVVVRLLLDAAEPGSAVVTADLTLPDALLDLLTSHGVTDLDAPALVLLTMAVHHLPAFQRLHLFDVLRKRLHPGTRLIITSLVSDPWSTVDRDAIMAAYTASPDLHLHPTAALRHQLTKTGWTLHERRTVDGVFTAVADLPPAPRS